MSDGRKKCGKCKQVKSRDQFYNAKAVRDGKQRWCISCQNNRDTPPSPLSVTPPSPAATPTTEVQERPGEYGGIYGGQVCERNPEHRFWGNQCAQCAQQVADTLNSLKMIGR